MDEVFELLVDKVKEKYIAKEILDIYYDFEVQDKYALVMLELKISIDYEVEDCIFGGTHSRRIHFNYQGNRTVEYEVNHPIFDLNRDIYLIIRTKKTDFRDGIDAFDFTSSVFDFERIPYK